MWQARADRRDGDVDRRHISHRRAQHGGDERQTAAGLLSELTAERDGHLRPPSRQPRQASGHRFNNVDRATRAMPTRVLQLSIGQEGVPARKLSGPGRLTSKAPARRASPIASA